MTPGSPLPILRARGSSSCQVSSRSWRIFRKKSCKNEETFRGKPILELCVDWDGPPYDHALAPGRYRLVLMLSCAHNQPVRKEMEIHFTGEWPKECNELGQLVTVELLKDPGA